MIFAYNGPNWIEVHETTIVAVAPGTNGRFDIVNDKGGTFAGISVSGAQASLNNGTPVATLNGDVPDLIYGVKIFGNGTNRISVFMKNNDAGAEDQVFKVVIFMKP